MPAHFGVNKNQCSPIFHISESSEEGRSPGDTLFPNYDKRNESPTVRTEDPRQQKYAYRSAADTIARETNNSRPYFPEVVQSPSQYQPQNDIQNKPEPHPQKFALGAGLNPFTDNEKINAINMNNGHLDTEMADRFANSRGPTPQSSNSYNHSSSNTSYSPSQAHDDDQNASVTGGGAKYMMGFTPQPHDTSGQQQEDPFRIPTGWDGITLGQGMTPGNMTGMTPDGGWEKLMDSIGWETGRTG